MGTTLTGCLEFQDWPAGWLAGWLADWLSGWLTGWFGDSPEAPGLLEAWGMGYFYTMHIFVAFANAHTWAAHGSHSS